MDKLANYVRGLDEQLSIIDRRTRGRYDLHLAHAAEASSRIEVAAWNVYKSQRTDIDSELSSNMRCGRTSLGASRQRVIGPMIVPGLIGDNGVHSLVEQTP